MCAWKIISSKAFGLFYLVFFLVNFHFLWKLFFLLFSIGLKENFQRYQKKEKKKHLDYGLGL